MEAFTMLILLAVIAFLCFMFYQREEKYMHSHDKLIDALVAKNAQELRDLKLANNTQIKSEPLIPHDEFTQVSEVSDKDFYKALEEQNS